MTRKPLTLKFDPQTVDHLGSRMYARLPNAVAELIANAYDADAHHVRIEIGEDSSVKVIDDGHGMSRADLERSISTSAEIVDSRRTLRKPKAASAECPGRKVLANLRSSASVETSHCGRPARVTRRQRRFICRTTSSWKLTASTLRTRKRFPAMPRSTALL